MTSDDVLLVLKQKIGQAMTHIGVEDYPYYQDDFLYEYLYSAWLSLEAIGVTTGVVVNKTTQTITPDTSNIIGMLIAYNAASSIINDDLVDKLRRGELGVSFRTATTEITTNQAAINLTSTGSSIKSQFDMLLTKYFAGDPDGVILRIQ